MNQTYTRKMEMTYTDGLELEFNELEVEFEYYPHNPGDYSTPPSGGYVSITSVKYEGVDIMPWIPSDLLEHMEEVVYERETDNRSEPPED